MGSRKSKEQVTAHLKVRIHFCKGCFSQLDPVRVSKLLEQNCSRSDRPAPLPLLPD